MHKVVGEGVASNFELAILVQPSDLRQCRFDTPIGQARDGQVSTAAKSHCKHLRGQDNERADHSTHGKANASIASLFRLVLAKRLLAAKVKRQTPALEFRVGIELGKNFGGDRRITGYAAVEADPGAFLFVIDARGPG